MSKVYVVEELDEEVYGFFKGERDVLTIVDSEDKAVRFIKDAVREDRERIRSRHFTHCAIEGYLNTHYGIIRDGLWVYSNTNIACDNRIYYRYRSYIVE